jgi:two-component system cell cycle sensor histidine kinase/response regulator CckA
MQPLDNITVLVAEDERPVRMLLRVVLEAAGARVIEAEHGGVALRLLALHPEVSVLCTDVHMPELDGPGLVAKARGRRPELPVVACSAMDLHTSHADLAARVDAVVRKPFVPSELVRAIDGAIAAHPRSAVVAS